MTVEAGLCQTWSAAKIVGFLTHRLILLYLATYLGGQWHQTPTVEEERCIQMRWCKEMTGVAHKSNLSRILRKPDFCLCENKGADQLRSNCEADHAFVFAIRIVLFIFFLNPKFQVSNHLLCLYRPVCVRPVRKPHCWFSHEAAQFVTGNESLIMI